MVGQRYFNTKLESIDPFDGKVPRSRGKNKLLKLKDFRGFNDKNTLYPIGYLTKK